MVRLAMIGLGRMGGNIARRLMAGDHEIVAFDRNSDAVATLAGEGAVGASSLKEVVAKLAAPRIFWVMLPAGVPTQSAVDELMELSEPGDIIIDGGNSFYKDDIKRGAAAKDKQLHYVDVGTSGGVWGLERGYCMMIGGDKEIVELLDPIFGTLAPGLGSIDRTVGRPAAGPRAAPGAPRARARRAARPRGPPRHGGCYRGGCTGASRSAGASYRAGERHEGAQRDHRAAERERRLPRHGAGRCDPPLDQDSPMHTAGAGRRRSESVWARLRVRSVYAQIETSAQMRCGNTAAPALHAAHRAAMLPRT
jgi:hypothetical protein